MKRAPLSGPKGASLAKTTWSTPKGKSMPHARGPRAAEDRVAVEHAQPVGSGLFVHDGLGCLILRVRAAAADESPEGVGAAGEEGIMPPQWCVMMRIVGKRSKMPCSSATRAMAELLS